MRWSLTSLLVSAFFLCLNGQTETEPYAALVSFWPKSSPEQLQSVQINGNWQKVSDSENIYCLRWSDSRSFEEVKQMLLFDTQGIRFVSPNYRATSRNRVPNDPSLNLQWYHQTIRSTAAWLEGTGGLTYLGDTVVIAVLEKGNIDFRHEDLQDVLWVNHGEIPGNGIDDDGNGYIDDHLGLNARTLRDNIVAPDNHATRIGGIIAARGNNGLGIVGVNWQTRILSLSNVDFMSEIIAAFEYVLNERTRYNNSNGSVGSFVVAINASFGFDRTKPGDDPIFEAWCTLIDRLGQVGVLTVGATSNNRWDVDFIGDMPTNCPGEHMFGITATNRLDTLDRSAAFGARSIDIGAPGDSMFSTRTQDQYNSDSGTSYAAPLVAGAIGLLYAMPDEKIATLARNEPAKAALEIKTALMQGAKSLPSLQGRTVSGGRLDLFGALGAFAKLGYGIAPDSFKLGTIWPNPVKETLYFQPQFAGFDSHEVLVMDMMGRVWYNSRYQHLFFPAEPLRVHVSHLPEGVYVLLLRNGKKTDAQKFIKAN